MGQLIDLSGKRFGRLQVIERVPYKKGDREAVWVCQCDCGNRTTSGGQSLREGQAKSCGCYASELFVKRNTTHGRSKTRLYKVWLDMKYRCYDPNAKMFKHYGGRGISVCGEWLYNFQKFEKWALENGYDPNAKFQQCTLDRRDNDGNYTPDNCRFVDVFEQNKNQRHPRWVPITLVDVETGRRGRFDSCLQATKHIGRSDDYITRRIREGKTGDAKYKYIVHESE